MTTELIPVAPERRLTADDKVRRLLDDFLAGLNPNTLRTYRQGLADFASFVGAADANQAAGNPHGRRPRRGEPLGARLSGQHGRARLVGQHDQQPLGGAAVARQAGPDAGA